MFMEVVEIVVDRKTGKKILERPAGVKDVKVTEQDLAQAYSLVLTGLTLPQLHKKLSEGKDDESEGN